MTDDYVSNPYDHFKAYDVISLLKPLLDGGNFYLRPEDGKVKADKIAISKDTPWIHIRHTVGFDCGLWNQIIFKGVVPLLPREQQFVPRNCQECWKVVVKPRTLQQLFNLLELQKALDVPAKCGIETRETVPGLYGGYFYNKSLAAGMECYNTVKIAMLENEYLAPLIDEVDVHGKTTRIILKRACTEFEHLLGDSTKWKVTPEQDFIEDLIDSYMVSDNLTLRQPDHVLWNIKRRWIEFAYQWGDPTYTLYTGGKPLYPHYITYHQPELLKEALEKAEKDQE